MYYQKDLCEAFTPGDYPGFSIGKQCTDHNKTLSALLRAKCYSDRCRGMGFLLPSSAISGSYMTMFLFCMVEFLRQFIRRKNFSINCTINTEIRS